MPIGSTRHRLLFLFIGRGALIPSSVSSVFRTNIIRRHCETFRALSFPAPASDIFNHIFLLRHDLPHV